MLDRHSRLAVPDESYFVPQLAHRHSDPPELAAFVDDLRRLPTLREWGIDPDDVAARLRPGRTLGEAIAAIYEAYAELHGKERWGDKTPMYMQHLPVLERLWPDARWVHLIRDGRDTAVSFLRMPAGQMTETWGHPRTAEDFACQWRGEVRAARAVGRRVGDRYLEVRYERLVEDPGTELRRISEHAGLAFEEGMTAYAGKVDVSAKPHQQSLTKPPTPGLRDWRRDLPPPAAEAFEGVAGDLLAELGYDLLDPPRAAGPTRRGRARIARYTALTRAYNTTAHALQRSPVWRRRHPVLARS